MITGYSEVVGGTLVVPANTFAIGVCIHRSIVNAQLNTPDYHAGHMHGAGMQINRYADEHTAILKTGINRECLLICK